MSTERTQESQTTQMGVSIERRTGFRMQEGGPLCTDAA